MASDARDDLIEQLTDAQRLLDSATTIPDSDCAMQGGDR
jgi:hypothetical protein